MGILLDKAIDPHQYDKVNAEWSIYGVGLQSPTRANFWEYLKPLLSEWKGKDILEIGSGTGWLLDLVLKEGAKSVLGIDPSTRSYELGKKLYSNVKLLNITFEKFNEEKNYDIVVGLLSLVNIYDIKAAFKKINRLLKPEGELTIIVLDYDYYKKSRFNYKITLEILNSDEYVAMVERPEIVTVSIVRKTSRYITVAKQSGFELIEDKPLPPTEILMRKMPRYRAVAGIPMARLLRFKKSI